MSWTTADLCDAHPDVQDAEPVFVDFGGRSRFCGQVATVAVYALIGDRLAALGAANGWAGAVVNGCVRDTAELRTVDLGVRALAACPRRSAKTGAGTRGELVVFAGVTFRSGDWLYADPDGIIVAPDPLH